MLFDLFKLTMSNLILGYFPHVSFCNSCQTKDNTEMILEVFIITFMICKNDHLICFSLLPSLIFLNILTTWIQLFRFKYISRIFMQSHLTRSNIRVQFNLSTSSTVAKNKCDKHQMPYKIFVSFSLSKRINRLVWDTFWMFELDKN